MPLPKGLARFNRRFSNLIIRPFAARLPWFAVIHHTGRVSGERYSTPVMAWRQGSVILVALTYGSDLDWLKNARKSDSMMTVRARTHTVGAPRPLSTADGMRRVPAVVRLGLNALDVEEFVEFPIR